MAGVDAMAGEDYAEGAGVASKEDRIQAALREKRTVYERSSRERSNRERSNRERSHGERSGG